jgi:hypothetical protein
MGTQPRDRATRDERGSVTGPTTGVLTTVPTTMLIIEKAITPHDLDYIVGLHAENQEAGLAPEKYVVVVPVGKENGKLLAVLDDLALANFKGADEDSRDEPLNQEVVEARDAMDESVRAFQAAGHEATGELLAGQTVEGLKQIAVRHDVDEIIVLTIPHLVEEFFHRDLASRLRKGTDLPTLRLLAHVELD